MVNMDDDKNQIFPLKNDFYKEKNVYNDVNYDNKLNQINQIFDNNHKKKYLLFIFLLMLYIVNVAINIKIKKYFIHLKKLYQNIYL